MEKRDEMLNPYMIQNLDQLEFSEFRQKLQQLMEAGYSPLQYFGSPEGILYSLMGKSDCLELLSTAFPNTRIYPSLSKDYPAFNMFERLLHEQYNIHPEGHPWLKAVRSQLPGENAHSDYSFLSDDSSLLHEVGVGPVHAGVIEPGHFRFICRGETVEHLEIQLGFQHRGLEQLMLQGDFKEKTALAESIAGDTAVGHCLAYCCLIEQLADVQPKGREIRIIALELERIAMHLADLSALAGDVAYIMGQNFFAAIRTTIINSSLAICGSRFGKRWMTPGGVNYAITKQQARVLESTLQKARTQIIDCAEAMFANSSVVTRFDDTGVLKLQDALALGLSGITAKASGMIVDARMDYPCIENSNFVALTQSSGDVYARAYLRYQEILQSLQMILSEINQIDFQQAISAPINSLAPNSICSSIVEGWRGRIVHTAKTDAEGKPIWYRITDPSLINWQALALVMRGTAISDFPICNKSFDLSYCGSDL